jgi:uncharacterized protein YbaR (Trm112 family)
VVIVACPDCATDLDELEPEREMGSAPVRFWCPFCEVVFERDASGMLYEIDN